MWSHKKVKEGYTIFLS